MAKFEVGSQDRNIAEKEHILDSWCITWNDLNRFILRHNSKYNISWEFITNWVYIVDILANSSIISFDMHTYEHMFYLVYVLDWIVFIDLILGFFTSFDKETTNMKGIK